jgi:GABA permease
VSPKASVLVVANRTADSSELIAALRQRAAQSPARFTLLVPAVPRGLSWAADMKAGEDDAIARAETSLQRLRLAGLDLTGAIVGDPDPLAAVGDSLHSGEFEEVIISTLPRGASHWLGLSLPDRLRRTTELPITHVVAAHTRRMHRMSRQRQPAALSH